MGVKGAEYVERFVDPGPPFDPALGPGGGFFQAVIEQAPEIVLAFGHDGTISYANDAVRVFLGYEPAALVGTNALLLVAPDDLENAARTIHHAAEVVGWRPPRPFRLVHADGRFITFEVGGLSLFHDERVRSIVIVGRWADAAARVDRVIGLLAAQRPIEDVLGELVHLLHRPGWQLSVTLQYDAGRGDGSLAATSSTGDPILSGLDSLHSGPWAEARATGQVVTDLDLSTVPDDVRAAAEAAGFVACWAVPIPDPLGVPACLVVWNAEALEPELGQDLLLGKLLSLVELAIDGRARSAALYRAAHCDPLTGLWNRRYLDAAAAAAIEDHASRMAIAVCDLDGFKRVNDELGHPAGDLVIRTVADRLRGAVRDTDVVARLGGDEFAILCPGVDGLADVEALAARIIEVVCLPIEHPLGAIRVGVSVGAAIADLGVHWDLDHLVRQADGQLLDAKAAGKATYRISVLESESPQPVV